MTVPEGAGVGAVGVGGLQRARREQVGLEAAVARRALAGEVRQAVKGVGQRARGREGYRQLAARLCAWPHWFWLWGMGRDS